MALLLDITGIKVQAADAAAANAANSANTLNPTTDIYAGSSDVPYGLPEPIQNQLLGSDFGNPVNGDNTLTPSTDIYAGSSDVPYGLPEPTHKQLLGSDFGSPVPGGGGVKYDGAPPAAPNNAPTIQFSEEKWGNFVKSFIFQGQTFFDYPFEVRLPFSKKSLNNFSGFKKPAYADLISEYNFYIGSYESIFGYIDEKLLPNLYFIFSELNAKFPNAILEQHINLGQNENIRNSFVRRPTTRLQPNFADTVGDYYDYYSMLVKNLREKTAGPIRAELGARFQNLVIPAGNIQVLKQYEKEKFQFPMYSELEFSTDTRTNFENILTEAKLDLFLIDKVVKDIDTSAAEIRRYINATEMVQEMKGVDGQETVTKKECSFSRDNYRTWDVMSWIEKLGGETPIASDRNKQLIDNSATDISFYLNSEEYNLEMNSSQQLFFGELSRVIFVGKLRTLVKEKFRTFEEMLKGKLAYSETVMYRIEKKTSTNKTVQNIYLANSEKEDVYRFIDTQIKFGVFYVYNVYAYQAVIGTSYEYSNLGFKGDRAWFKVKQIPHVQLVEVPYFSFNTACGDCPPPSPEIEIIPFKGNCNEIKIWLNGGIGDYMMEPVPIYSEDYNIFMYVHKVKNTSWGDKIRFRSDDHSGMFQVFRLDKQPSSYKDFANGLVADVRTDVSALSFQKATSAAKTDIIKPNKKYWYCARTIDIHGLISNPTPVFQVELVEENGVTYMVSNVVDFPEEKKKTHKSGRKYLLIRPNLNQTMINEEKTGIVNADSVKDINSVTLGVADESLWGKQFLLRIKSKQSGRIIEMRLKFQNDFVRTS